MKTVLLFLTAVASAYVAGGLAHRRTEPAPTFYSQMAERAELCHQRGGTYIAMDHYYQGCNIGALVLWSHTYDCETDQIVLRTVLDRISRDRVETGDCEVSA